jgi:hypothetical protein
MSAKAGRLERQRARIRELSDADPSRSHRSIAAELGCSHVTVGRVRGQVSGPLTTGDEPPHVVSGQNPGAANLIEPAGPGNDRAVRHGAYSAARRAPLEQEHRSRLRLAYPTAPDDLINTAATRCALISLFGAWLEDSGPILPSKGVPVVQDAARELRRLTDAHDAAIERLEARTATSPGDEYAVVLQEIASKRKETT